MYQVKIFNGRFKKVEEEFQNFLNQNPNIEIINFKQAAGAAFIVITLIYKIKE